MNLGLHLDQVRLESLEADSQHPNKMKFRGVLVRLDEPSTKAPNGSQGHKILVSTEVAKRRLRSLIGMGLNYSPDLDAHAQRRKVGVINRAWIDGRDLKVEGHIWKHDFPEAEKDLKQRGLGMSMELGDVRVDHPHADIWALDDFQFLGATILWRDSAAYNRTQAIAARAEQRSEDMKNTSKGTTKTSPGEKVAQIAAQAAATAVKQGTTKLLSAFREQTEVLRGISAAQDELAERVAALEAGSDVEEDEDIEAGDSSFSAATEDASGRRIDAKVDDKDEEDDQEDDDDDEDDGDGEMETKKMKADAKKKAAGSSSSSSSSQQEDEFESAMDDGDLEETDPLAPGGNAGHLNEDAKNHGDDTTENDKVGKTVASSRIRALKTANKHLRNQMKAQLQAADERYAKLEKRITKLQSQVSAASEKLGRRSVSPELASMLAKANIDAGDLLRSNTKLTVAEVDGIIASTGLNLSPQDRVAWKNGFYRSGLMEDGRVQRNAR